ncbi:serum amyloid P-component-like [Cheilinus undulatus]|uniref:serum amyloid P-component-like n=1 Tax=Cheilinus undulatus TaxID=241271 RepID=UPI001BD20D28|nr:serum amyloid P-component-like [Cheilinus undulatus]
MMKLLLIFLASLCAGHAGKKECSEKLFVFPVSSNDSFAKIIVTLEKPLTAATMCMRYFSSLTRAQSLFSLASLDHPNAFLLFKPSVGVYQLQINGESLEVSGLHDETDDWNSVCWTWDSKKGLNTLWVNRKRSGRIILGANASITGRPSIILGQDQDNYGGGFDKAESFVGDITDVHLWSSAISPCEISLYMKGCDFTPGNLLNWRYPFLFTAGSVYEEQSDFVKLTCFF